jgi:signal transduction histidine kinase
MLRIKGTGLGLFLVRSIARQHGGNATASSPGLNRGTTVTLTLPLANAAAASETTTFSVESKQPERAERV